jgi:hypothetical protein
MQYVTCNPFGPTVSTGVKSLTTKANIYVDIKGVVSNCVLFHVLFIKYVPISCILDNAVYSIEKNLTKTLN